MKTFLLLRNSRTVAQRVDLQVRHLVHGGLIFRLSGPAAFPLHPRRNRQSVVVDLFQCLEAQLQAKDLLSTIAPGF